MAMVKVMSAAVVALLAGMWVEGARARADETFVCEGGRLVRAKTADLERLKRTDECIARYFGLSVADVETSLDAVAPVVAPAGVPAAEPAAATKVRDVGSDPATTVGRVTEAGPARPKLPSDYRNVLLLNHAPGASPYFILGR